MSRNFILIIFAIYILSSFGCNNNELSELESQYNILKKENDKLKEQINSLEFWPIAVAKSNNIKLGETYMANIRLAVSDTNEPPKVIFDNSEIVTDSIKNSFDKFYQCSVLEIKPENKGNFEIPGKIYFNLCGRKIESKFSISYKVN